jgi:putative ABC transport system permease protein
VAGRTLLLRWSWRDLRHRWLLVTAISLVIALGTGTYAALMSTGPWRTESNDASFALLDTHDLRVRLNEGSTAAEGTLARVVREVPSAARVTSVRERLVLPTQVASGVDLIAPGEIVGSALGSTVDGLYIHEGSGPVPADDGRPVGVLDLMFARENGLPDRGSVRLSGGATMQYTGHGQSPEYFILTPGQGALPFLGQESYAVVYTTLHTAQNLLGRPGQVNDVVLTVLPGTDTDRLAAEIQDALQHNDPPLGATVTDRAELDSYRILYDDIEGDRRLWQVLGSLLLLGAAFAALNLTSRVIEAQRHEIGIGMALGVPARVLALRPLLFAAQIALGGVLLGLVVGWLVGIPLSGVFVDLLPLPVWHTDFQAGEFAKAAALGFVLPFAASIWPVWRALRVQPVDAIRVGHLSSTAQRRSRHLPSLPVPGPSYRQVPLRNLVRAPRRTTLTVLGIAAAIATMVSMVGLFDSFTVTIDEAEEDLLHESPDRVTASLATLEPVDGQVVTDVRALPSVGPLRTGILLPVTASRADEEIELVTEVVESDALWRPTLVEGSLAGGLVLSEKAARDLDVGVGDSVTLEHPQVVDGSVQTGRTTVNVSGLHPNPLRMLAYADSSSAAYFGFGGLTNLLTIEPADGYTADQVRRELLSVPRVGAAQSTKATVDAIRVSVQQFLSVLQVAVVIALALAILIAFNSTSIAADERSRDHATMLAFGLPVRTVLGLTVVETLILGALGTIVGIAGGYGIVTWVVQVTLESTLPEVQIQPHLAAGTWLLAGILGIGAVGAAPVLLLRRIRKMDIPSTLRVME